MKKIMKDFLKDEAGATAIEYGLIAALLSIGIILAVTATGTSIQGIFSTTATTLQGAAAQTSP